MDANEKDLELQALADTVNRILDEIIHRRTREKKTRELKVAVLLYMRLAYQLGGEHAMKDFVTRYSGNVN